MNASETVACKAKRRAADKTHQHVTRRVRPPHLDPPQVSLPEEEMMHALRRRAGNPAVAIAVPSSRHDDAVARRALLYIAAVPLALVVLTAAPARPSAEEVAQHTGPIALVGSLPGLQPPVRDASSPSVAERESVPRFFGFLEFDWDPNAPGGVPGFGPWPADGGTPR